MTLPTSGQLKFSDIAGEFGGSAPYDLNNYYAGGPHVPSGTTGINGAVPTSGALAFSKFYGTSNYGPFVFGCPDNTPSHVGSPGAPASFDQAMTAAFVSGGPISGSMSYLWSVNSWSPFQPAGSVLQNTTLQTCNVHFNIGAHGANQQIIANLSCLVTDLVSGLTDTFSCNASVIFN